METQGVQVDHAAHAAERQALLMGAPADVLAAVRKEASTAFHRRSRRRLQRGEGDYSGQEKTFRPTLGWSTGTSSAAPTDSSSVHV
jgi:hypothetical protein